MRDLSALHTRAFSPLRHHERHLCLGRQCTLRFARPRVGQCEALLTGPAKTSTASQYLVSVNQAFVNSLCMFGAYSGVRSSRGGCELLLRLLLFFRKEDPFASEHDGGGVAGDALPAGVDADDAVFELLATGLDGHVDFTFERNADLAPGAELATAGRLLPPLDEVGADGPAGAARGRFPVEE